MRDGSFPLVSVVTPTYNRANFLPETIESVLNQTYPNIEYIVLDDGSSDKTTEILPGYGARLQWQSHPNRGESYTVNKGFNLARGQFITIVNSDDPVTPDFVATAVDFLRSSPKLLMAYPDWYIIDAQSYILEEHTALDYDYLDMIRRWGCVPGPGAVLRRKALDLVPGRDLTYRYVADFDYWLRLGLHGPFARIPALLATHRHHANSAGVQLSNKVSHEIMLLARDFFRRPNLPLEVQKLRSKAFASANFEAGIRLHAESPFNRYLLKSIAYDPSFGYARLRRHAKDFGSAARPRRDVSLGENEENELHQLRMLAKSPWRLFSRSVYTLCKSLLPSGVRTWLRSLGSAGQKRKFGASGAASATHRLHAGGA